MTTLTHLDPFMLVRAKDGSVLSFRHRVLAGAVGNRISEEQSAAAVIAFIQDGTWEAVSDPDVKPSLRTCLECGCTDEFRCEGGCSWYSVDCCSSCAGMSLPRPRGEIETEINLAYAQADKARVGNSIPAIELACIQCELLLDIRDSLADQAVAQTASLHALLSAGLEGSERRIVTAGADLLR